MSSTAVIGMLTESARKKLEAKNFVYLATIFPDGSPQVTPVWVDTDGKYVLVNTAMGRVKQKNVKKNPEVALSISDPTNPYDFLQIRGKVVEQVTGKVAEDHIDKLNMKYHGKPKYNHRPGEQRVILKIVPEKVSSWG
ncbi:MAG TPA: PPOX class F420-dependent oxidoreductase [Candidatus Bathyarchaeia archaeon]